MHPCSDLAPNIWGNEDECQIRLSTRRQKLSMADIPAGILQGLEETDIERQYLRNPHLAMPMDPIADFLSRY